MNYLQVVQVIVLTPGGSVFGQCQHNEPLNVLLESKRLRHDVFHRVRIVHELPSLAERLSGAKKQNGLLERLVSLYRWKSNLQAQDSSRERDFRLYFPMFDPEILANLEMHSWPGNLREIERVCFELDGKRETSRKPDVDFLRQQLHRVPTRNIATVVMIPPPSSTDLARLRSLETILLKHDLDLDASSVPLGEVRLSTRRHLLKFLRRHKDSMSSEFAAHPRAGKFLAPLQCKSVKEVE